MGGYQVLLSKLFLSHSAEKIRGVTLQCFGKFIVWDKNLWRRDGGITFFRRKIFVSQCQKVSWGNHSMFQKNWGCFRKIEVSKKFMHKKGISLFSGESFLSHSAEKFVFRKNFGIEKFHT